MTPREWFQGILGWEYGLTGFGQPVWVSPEGEQVYINPPPILEEQEAWIQYVAKPMRGMGYTWAVPDNAGRDIKVFIWVDDIEGAIFGVSQIIDDNIFQASLDAAEKCPEVKERLQAFRESGKLETG